ncbi:MAG TPA: RNA 2',3'-cyclic phosphodiesterase [Candidatus Nanoarchaeia archaeon]|nr:RNA 2',3'-cyclic phosphodiesterase [Candidatus Nanoarchaeia archaeon]
MKRLFVGIPISEKVKLNLGRFIEQLTATGADLNLVSIENLHFTVKFLGDVAEDKIAEINEKLKAAIKNKPKFKAQLREVGVFPSWQMINVIWIGTDSRELISIIHEASQALDYIRPEESSTAVAHLTVARVKSRKNKEQLQEVLQKFKLENFGEMVIDKIVLYESKLTATEPIYTEIERFLLK